MAADIAKCSGEECAKRDKCKRFTSPANRNFQLYLTPEIINGDCKDFYPNPDSEVELRDFSGYFIDP